jgi:hypothetical protein
LGIIITPVSVIFTIAIISTGLRMKFLRSLLLLFYGVALQGQNLTNYEVFIGWGTSILNPKEVIVFRRFLKEGNLYYLTLSPQSLKTDMQRSDSFTVHSATWETLRSRYSATPYITALRQAERLSDTLQNAGFTRLHPTKDGIDLTIDLCPSKLPLDRIVFTDLIQEVGGVEKPIPIAVSVTGRWMERHAVDLLWLDSLVKTGNLSITWINHSYNHYTSKNAPLKTNFMLASGTNVKSEVLNTEIALLKKNIIPSIFFRFPGLVSDQKIYNEILYLGLIPVGSDAWLAKGQWPKNGSIVLIHANGNEPLGVKEFIKLLKSKRADVLSKRWELFDLRESLIESEKK